MLNMTSSKLRRTAAGVILVVAICGGIAATVEKTRRYINQRIDRMLAERTPPKPEIPPPPPPPPPASTQSAFDKKAEIELHQLSARVATLESLLAGAGGTLVDHAPDASEYRGRGAPVLRCLMPWGPIVRTAF